MKNKRIYFTLILFAVFMMIFELKDRFMVGGVAMGNASLQPSLQEETLSFEWNDLISESVNKNGIKLFVDGKQISVGVEQIYMDKKMNLMIPTSIITNAFSCSVNTYDKDHIFIQKGNTKITAKVEQDYYIVNELIFQMEKSIELLEGSMFLNAQIFKTGLGYSYNWDVENNALYLSDNKSGENILPAKFSYKDIYKIPAIKNQGSLSTCWAFASLTALETSMMPEERLILSVDNMSMNSGYVGLQTDGGDYTRAMAYLASWKGPILESDDPYGDGVYSLSAKPVKHVQEIQLIESKNFESIKRAVFMHGGVQSSLYTSMVSSTENSVFYNKNNSSYCYIGTQKPNHDVVIVGWDDYYSKANFNGNLEGDGAFICMNSWGSSFGDEGIFYVSYYDSNIGMHNVVYTGVESVKNYDNIYQSDLCGWVGQMGYEDDTAYFSNVYTVKENESLEAVSFYATDKSTEYEIYFVNNYIDTSSFDDRVLIKKGSFVNAGYYTVDLDRAFDLYEGTQYAIVVKIKTPNSIHPIAVEYKAGASTANVNLSDGDGYISLSGRSWEHVEESKNCNICLKMFTNKR